MNKEDTTVKEIEEIERPDKLEEVEHLRLSLLVEKQKSCALGLELIKAKFEEGKRMLEAANKDLEEIQKDLSAKYGEDADCDLLTGKLKYKK